MEYIEDKIITALDIGTTKICALAGRLNQFGKLEVLGYGKVSSEGVLRGMVSNIDKTVTAIREAVELAEHRSGIHFKAVHVGIAGQHIRSLQHQHSIMRKNKHEVIREKDIQELFNDMHKLTLSPGEEILHLIPQEFSIDQEQGIIDPIGWSGTNIKANFHVIVGQVSASNIIKRCVEKAGLTVASLNLEPIASSVAVLSNEEKEAGVALVDIGGGTTDLAIFYEGIVRHTAVIPFGGNVITSDIKEGCKVLPVYAELLKHRFGSALAAEVYENRMITIPGIRGRDPKEISEKNLAYIIQARVEEIFDIIEWEVKRSGFDKKLLSGIVLTGGGALLKNIDKLVEYHTSYTTKVGYPTELLGQGHDEEIINPMFATGIGLLLRGMEVESRHDYRQNQTVAETEPAKAIETAGAEVEMSAAGKRKSWLEKLFNGTNEFFGAGSDKELR